ncbi:MAG: hypothetical protein NZ920_02195 [Aigarchaeota archaeon]|nr:hypothetical protein [Aigarchaeota archaeon]MDW8092563.1 hypothetical protein [Nitrososphaerota archaeon]
MSRYDELVKSFMMSRFNATEVKILRIHESEEVTEVSGEVKMSGVRKRFTVLIRKDDDSIMGYGLR